MNVFAPARQSVSGFGFERDWGARLNGLSKKPIAQIFFGKSAAGVFVRNLVGNVGDHQRLAALAGRRNASPHLFGDEISDVK